MVLIRRLYHALDEKSRTPKIAEKQKGGNIVGCNKFTDELVRVGIAACILVFLLIAFLIFPIWYGMQESDPVRFDLTPISDGVYAYRQIMVSSIPEENYDMLTVCKEDGHILTVKGNIAIVFDDEVKPYGVYVDSNTVNNDSLTVYVPSDSVEIYGAIRVD